MQKRLNHFMLLFVILAVIVTSAVRTTAVYADDGVTDPPTGESTPAPEGEGAVTEEAPPAESPAVEESAAPEIPVAEPTSEASAAATEIVAEAPVTEPAAEEQAVEKPAPVTEILEQLPEDTTITVLNGEGDPEPLVTQEAADIVQSGDPRYTVGGVTYYFMPTLVGCGALLNCTTSDTPIQAAIDALSGSGATPDDGTIYIDAGTYTENVTVNGNSWSGGSRPTALTISGAGSATTTLNGSLSIANMNTFTLSGITVTGANSAAAILTVSNNAGDLTLDDVSATNTAGDGASLSATGNVAVNGSNFSNSTGNGLIVTTMGNIDVATVTASNNSLTGTYLNSCLYELADPGLCAGNGIVSVTGASLFENNGIGGFGDGLFIDSGGGIQITDVQATGNGLHGAYLQSADDDGTGNVTVDGGVFTSNGTGLEILADRDIEVGNVESSLNNMGAVLDTTFASGTIYVHDSSFGTGSDGNNWTGLHVTSGSTIRLEDMEASNNGTNGAYLLAEGAITVTNSTFNGNVKSGTPEDPGLFAWSDSGSITLDGVTASNNVNGAGVVLLTNDTSAININSSFFNQNGTFGIQANTESGNITLTDVVANYNGVKGAYLYSCWLGNIAVNNSTFVENGVFGIFAATADGNINVNNVTVMGSDGAPGPGADDLTDYGANLATATGSVTVTNSSFTLNTDVGLDVVAGNQVTLTNVTAEHNGGTDVEVFSITTGGPICNGETPVSIDVTVNGGTFTYSGGYGLMVKPGPAGTLVFTNPATFGNNGWGDYLLDLSQEFKDCTCPPEPEKPPEKGPKIVDVPETGGPTVAQDCDLYTGTILKLPDGTWVEVSCPFEGFSKLEQVPQGNLPGPFGAGINFVKAISLGLTDAQGNFLLNEEGTVTINFAIPKGSHARGHSILFWDPKANNGAGSWVELPPYEVGTSFPLNPKDPNDHRTILSGVRKAGDFVTTTVNFSGVFALIER